MIKDRNQFNLYNCIKNYIKLKSKELVIIDDCCIITSNCSKIFLTVTLLNKSKITVKKSSTLKVKFKNTKISNKVFIAISKLTLPFFVGLPGFLNKQFIVCEKQNEFTGIYTWESEEVINEYLESYAMRIMKWWSKPFELVYEIN